MSLTKPVLEKVGYGPGCNKCAAMRRGDKVKTQNLLHSDECRARVEKKMMKDASMKRSVQGATDRQNEWLAKMVGQPEAQNKQNATAATERAREEPSSNGDPARSILDSLQHTAQGEEINGT